MKTLYLDCGMGAAGDMLTAALLDLLPEPEQAVADLNALEIPGIRYVLKKSVKCGITGNQISVLVDGMEEDDELLHHTHEHSHSHEYDEQSGSHEDEHDHEHSHAHGHDHEHSHAHEHGHHEHTHEHHHEHSHEDDGHHHYHSTMQNIASIVHSLRLSDEVKADILAVYGLIAQAESTVHGVPVPQIHFHEVGTMDAVADVTAVCFLLRRLGAEQIIASPVHTGSGQVHCAHGILPVPTPATAFILRDIPIYGGSVQGELCTPTGAALLKHFVSRFDSMPLMRVEKIGYGMGKRDFERANCVRALFGQTSETEVYTIESGMESAPATDTAEKIVELSCNLDDMTAEDIAFAMEVLLQNGAKDVYTVPVCMKKSRPGTLLHVLCGEGEREKMIRLLFRHTSTLGVRETVMRRYTLTRGTELLQTPYGSVHRKTAQGYDVLRSKYEYEDLAKIARERQISLKEVRYLLEGKP